MPHEFEALINDLELLQKSARPEPKDEKKSPPDKEDADDKQDDKDIKAAADGDQDDDGEPDSEDALDDYDDDDDDERDTEKFGKSFSIVTVDGEQIEAYDGRQILTELSERMAALENDTKTSLSQIAKALGQSTDLIKSLRSENEAMRDSLNKIASSGRGRKSVLNVHDKPAVGENESLKKSFSPKDLMAKALSAQREGRMTGVDVACLDAYLGRGSHVPEELLAKLDA